MATTTTHRKIVTYKWFCTDKERCEQIDEQIDELVMHSAKLSEYVLNKQITGLECLTLDAKFKGALKELRADRASLWRRVRKETEEDEVIEDDSLGVPNESGTVGAA